MLKREWVGRRVRILEDLQNRGGDVFTAGTVMEVTRNFGGLWLESLHLCPACLEWKKRSIAKIRETRVTLLPIGYTETIEERLLRAGKDAARRLGIDADAFRETELRLRESRAVIAASRRLLVDGLRYHEHDGHNMPKRVTRDALIALGVPEEDQP